MSIRSSDNPNGIFKIVHNNSMRVIGEEIEDDGPPTKGFITFARDKGSFYAAQVTTIKI